MGLKYVRVLCLLAPPSDYSLTQDPGDDVPDMIEDPERTAWARVFRMDDPEEVPAAWKTIAVKSRPLQHVPMGLPSRPPRPIETGTILYPYLPEIPRETGTILRVCEPRTCSRHFCQMKIV